MKNCVHNLQTWHETQDKRGRIKFIPLVQSCTLQDSAHTEHQTSNGVRWGK